MIAIVNVSKHSNPTGLHTYELRINREVVATFTHRREHDLAQCLRLAAAAADKAKAEKIASQYARLDDRKQP